MFWIALALAAGPSPREVVGSGDCAPYVAKAQAPSNSAERLARGWCLLALDRPEEALTALKGAETDFGPYLKWLSARALVDAGRPAEALPLLDGLKLPSPLADELDLLRARARGAVDPADGLRALKALIPTRGPEAWLAIGAVHDNEGRRDEAVDAYREAWVDARPGGWDAEAIRRLDALGSPLPGAADKAWLERRIASLKKYNRHDEALTLREVLTGGEVPTQRDAILALAAARSRARDHAGAAVLWAKVYGAPDVATGPPDALFDYALSNARTGDYATAAKIYRRLIAQHPASSQADFASFKLGYMHWDAREIDEAVQAFTEHIQRYPTSKHLDESLWFRAQSRWDSDRAAAVADFVDLQKQRGGSSLAPGAAYWQAVARIESGDAAGREALEKLINNWPTSGYAWFAAARVGRRFPKKPDATAPEPSAALAGQLAWKRARAFTEAGLLAWARAELATLKPGGTDTLAYAWALHDAGDYRQAQKLACPLAGKPWEDKNPAAQQVCIPRPERLMVEAVAQRHGLDPSLAYGVMVAESALDPLATSPVGARGLMQLMPEVAGRLHPDLFPNRPFDPDDLYLAPYNAALGAHELGQRTGTLKNVLATTSVPAVVASYNAGEEAVRRWLDPSAPAPAFDEWSEDISFSETRTYVKRVLGNAMAVRWVYGD